jgi:predicted RNase H-like nuclease
VRTSLYEVEVFPHPAFFWFSMTHVVEMMDARSNRNRVDWAGGSRGSWVT